MIAHGVQQAKKKTRTDLSILTSLLLRSCSSFSIPIRSISSYILNTAVNSSFASNSAASNCSSSVNSAGDGVSLLDSPPFLLPSLSLRPDSGFRGF